MNGGVSFVNTEKNIEDVTIEDYRLSPNKLADKPAVLRLATEAWRGKSAYTGHPVKDTEDTIGMDGSNNFWANYGRPDKNLDSSYFWFYNAWNACFFWSQPYNEVNDSEGYCRYRATIGRSSYNIEQKPSSDAPQFRRRNY